MFDIVFQPIVSEFDGTNIILTCLAGHLTIFAFGYPYIYRAINNLSIISTVLTSRINNSKLRKIYPKFTLIAFIINLFSLLWCNYKIISVISCIILLLHIIYIMYLYKYIENFIINPFNMVINKDIHKNESIIKKNEEFENDIILVIDIICYATKTTFSEAYLQEYFDWIIDATFHSFKIYDIEKFDSLFGVLPEDTGTIFSTLIKIQWLNQWLVKEKKIEILDNINRFYMWALYYGIPFSKNFNRDAHPILNSIETIDSMDKYCKKYELIQYIQNNVLEIVKYSLIYRIENGCISYNEMNNFVELIYFILSNKIKMQEKEKYEPCFSIIASLIDHNMISKCYKKMIKSIKNHHDYNWGKESIYEDVCGFHVNVLSYLIYRNQYQTLKEYLYEEEPPDRVTQYTRPQIPNSINSILYIFIGHNSVFYNTQTFAANTSSYKYKFYTLFLLLMYSKNFADRAKQNLSKLKKDDWNYKIIKKDMLYHSECSIDFNNIPFDILMSYNNIKKYNEFLKNFKEEIELLNIFEYNNESEKFIKRVLDNSIKMIGNAQKKLLKETFETISEKDFSLYNQNKLGAKNLRDYVDRQFKEIYERLEKLNFNCIKNNTFEKKSLILYENEYNKKEILSNEQYQYLFVTKQINNIYYRIFEYLKEKCEYISLNNIPTDLKDFEILSNVHQKNQFVKLGIDDKYIKVKKTIVNGKNVDNYEYADIESIELNGQKIKVSAQNYHFKNFNNIETNSAILLIDTRQIAITVNELRQTQFSDTNKNNVKIYNGTEIIIELPKNQNIGYCIIKENNK